MQQSFDIGLFQVKVVNIKNKRTYSLTGDTFNCIRNVQYLPLTINSNFSTQLDESHFISQYKFQSNNSKRGSNIEYLWYIKIRIHTSIFPTSMLYRVCRVPHYTIDCKFKSNPFTYYELKIDKE